MAWTIDPGLCVLQPPQCVICAVSPGAPVCRGCLHDWLDPDLARCPVCALRAADAARRCSRCLAHPPAFDSACTLGDYAPPLAGMVVALKSGARLDLARPLARLLAARIAMRADATAWHGARVVPLPLAWERHAERGFNQAAELARALARAAALPLATAALVRVRHGAPQHTLDESARRRNVHLAFAASAPLPWPAALLVDDVCTTGATLDDAARALKAAGVARVCAVTLARTP